MQAGYSTKARLVPSAEIAVLRRKVASLTVINLQPLAFSSVAPEQSQAHRLAALLSLLTTVGYITSCVPV